MFSAFARRAVRVLPQVRLIRGQPQAAPRVTAQHARQRRPTEEPEEMLYVGDIVEEKFEKFPRPAKKDPLDDPSVMTLVHRQDVKEGVTNRAYTPDELSIFDRIEEIKIEDALKNYKESQFFDADFLDSLGPGMMPTYNVAALADKNEVIRNLVGMGVSVAHWDEKPDVFKTMVKLNWHEDCVPRIEFLVKECGLGNEELARVLRRNPCILSEDMQHMRVRLEFLRNKQEGLGLRRADIVRILSKESRWLSQSVEYIENRISFFRNHFALTKAEFTQIVVSRPQVMLVTMRNLALRKFTMIEEMGLSSSEMKAIIKKVPKILTINRFGLLDRFQVLHLDIGYPHEVLVSDPRALLSRASRLKERHAFLKHVGRDQFDRTMPGYISPSVIARGTDEVFVEEVAKSTKEVFEDFIKSL
ncbi:transcription termination factor 3, mitochondrial [Galendromus occidentalis]|uniref:Transcription termination factor 3, mitochondrial n=1 Tax=Galendromus occidentalis TaxID=34638 RepID=A0AAJ6QUF5_9ACAR|nr:transcription termination factor 3, mitochondrial [Galendromus occidentalis]